MSTLLLRLAGPMQAWGTQSRYRDRDTEFEPSKSGVIGLLCAACGRPREESVDDLAELKMGVRVDREGKVLTDYQTAGGIHRQSDRYDMARADVDPRRTAAARSDRYGVARANGSVAGTAESRRTFLADADFLVGLEGEDVERLRRLDEALGRPVWPLFLGRKAFVPGVPVALPDGGVRDGMGLVEALKAEPWPRPDLPVPPSRRAPRLRLVLEVTDPTGAEVRVDQPVGAAFRDRRFDLRHVETRFCDEIPVREE